MYQFFRKNGSKGPYDRLEGVAQYLRLHQLKYLDLCKLAKDRGFSISEDDISKAICGRRLISYEAERFLMDVIGVDDPGHLLLAPYTDKEAAKIFERYYHKKWGEDATAA